jgi:AraC-like DNA-binding protein
MEERKELFKKAIVVQPENLTSTGLDEAFVKKVLASVERHLSNTGFSVEQLSGEMNMDRTGLYRKLVAIVGQTPTEFIRMVRLKRAVTLLEQGFLVNEVADKVGFGTVSYFSKCFQEEYGVKPSQYGSKS